MQFLIPGLTKPAPYLIRGNPVFFCSALGRTASTGMADVVVINDAVYSKIVGNDNLN
jgi:hypothetical protein